MGKAVERNEIAQANSIPPKPRFEFSKIMMVIVGILNVTVIVFAMIIMWKTNDPSPLAYLIPSVSGECGVVASMYLNKAKIENRLKLMRIYGIEPKRPDFTENGSISDGEEYYNGGMSI